MPVVADHVVWNRLQADRISDGTPGSSRASVPIPFAADLGARLDGYTTETGVSVAALLTGAVFAAVARYTGDEVAVQVTARALRHCAGSTDGGGCPGFASVELDLSDDPGMAALAGRLQVMARTLLDSGDALDHDCRSPIVVDLAVADDEPADATDIETTEICCAVQMPPGALAGTLMYDASRFDAAVMHAFAATVAALAAQAVTQPAEPASQLPVVDAVEQHRILTDWNRTTVARAPDAMAHRLFEREAWSTPDAIAAEYAGHTLTFRELNTRGNLVARDLVTRGVPAESLVAVAMERSLELLVAIVGVLKAGCAYVPLDADLPADRLTYVLTDTKAPLVLTQPHLVEKVRPAAAMADATVVTILPVHDTPSNVQTANLPDRTTAWGTAYVIYTSGSTGVPKGVRVPHRALCNHARWFADTVGLTAQDRMLQYASISFDASMAELFAPLLAGAPVVFAPPYAHRDVLGITEIVREERITVLQMVPTALRAALGGGGFEECRSLRYLVSGGEALDRTLVAEVRRALPALRIGNFYGPSEASVDATQIEIADAHLQRAILPIGRPIANARCYVLDRHHRPVPVGAPGELYIAGLGLADGYHGKPALTERKFIADPFVEGERMYRSGDRVRFAADGTIEYLGRLDTQVKVRGYRIELAEVETALLHHPGVKEAAVVVRRDELGDAVLVAYLVCPPGTVQPVPQALTRRLRQRLPAYMVPSVYAFLDALPLTSSAKLDRRQLERLPLPRVVPRDPQGRPTLDDPIQDRLREIWEQNLGVSPVGADDDFFALGGHSLKAIRLLNEVEREFGIYVRAGVLFEAPTIRQFAARLRERKPRPVSTTIPVQPHGNRLPLFFVPGGGGELFVFEALARELGPEQPLHVMDLYAFGEGQGAGAPVPSITLPQIAARMIDDLRHVQPVGPYRLAGYSLGGNIAIEIARQLRVDGHDVSTLVLLDCDGPGYPRLQPPARRTLTHLAHAVSLGPSGAVRYLRDRLQQVARRLRGEPPPRGRLFETEEDVALIPADVIERMERALHPLVRAWESYVPARYDGRVTLVRADIRQAMVGVDDTDPLLGWSGVLTNLQTVRMGCGHFDVLRAPQAATLARILRSALVPPD